MRFLLIPLVLALTAPVALADGGGPAKVDLEKATKKGSAPATKAGAADQAGHELHASSAKEGGARVDLNLYLYDAKAGTPLKSATDKVVCNPCTFGLTGDVTKINFDALLADKGGFPKETPSAIAYYTLATDDMEDATVSWVTTGETALKLEVYFLEAKHLEKAAL